MYVWRRTLRRQEEILPPWGTTLGVALTVSCTPRWGQIPTAVGHGGRNLASWPTAAGDLAPCSTTAASWCRGARRQRHGYIRG
jgi:hypothetical protein